MDRDKLIEELKIIKKDSYEAVYHTTTIFRYHYKRFIRVINEILKMLEDK